MSHAFRKTCHLAFKSGNAFNVLSPFASLEFILKPLSIGLDRFQKQHIYRYVLSVASDASLSHTIYGQWYRLGALFSISLLLYHIMLFAAIIFHVTGTLMLIAHSFGAFIQLANFKRVSCWHIRFIHTHTHKLRGITIQGEIILKPFNAIYDCAKSVLLPIS